ncbi:hypothetical protein DI272_19030 [Streptomyces sp. Act143]|uniref:hypothetical protein n=1 Tax=Streptomyces sp. Act143 TaxID=2200760 RepID=UPI000D6785A4|nr:hypothetical protein [Streptomyces sp. Act143]PWI16028.1 hypothetical protein DI272_19030 [Streptomyces sp. Act143]
MSEPRDPVAVAVLALADRIERDDPSGVATMSVVLDVAESVTQGADQTVLAGMIPLILTPEPRETWRAYAARLREGVAQ